MKLGQTVLGKSLFGKAMKSTFYGHFVAGEDQEDIKPTIHRMHTFGVKSILDYSVEEDVSSEDESKKEMDGGTPMQKMAEPVESKDAIHLQFSAHEPALGTGTSRKWKNFSARTYFYENEATCERNAETFLRCIEAVADSTHATGFSAIKLTALGRPSLLVKMGVICPI